MRIILFLIPLTFTVLLVVGVVGVVGVKRDKQRLALAEEHYQRGIKYCKENWYEAGISEYRKAIELNPEHSRAHRSLGSEYYRKKDYYAAFDAFQAALAFNPSDPETHFGLSRVYSQWERYDNEMAELKTVLSLDPDYIPAYYYLGLRYKSKKEYQKAIENFKKCLKLNSDSEFADEISEHIKRLSRIRSLITNGDFKADWRVGWTQQMQGGSNRAEVVIHNGRNKLFLSHKGSKDSYMALYQEVPIEHTRLTFIGSFQLKAFESRGFLFTRSGIAYVLLDYLDMSGTTLGQTYLCSYVKHALADTGMFGVPRLTQSTDIERYVVLEQKWYENYVLDINSEIRNNLPGVNPADVKSIRVAFYVGGGSGGGAEMMVDRVRLEVRQ